MCVASSFSDYIFHYYELYSYGIISIVGIIGKLGIGPLLLLILKSIKPTSQISSYYYLHFTSIIIVISFGRTRSLGYLNDIHIVCTLLLTIYLAYSTKYLFTLKQRNILNIENRLSPEIKAILLSVFLVWISFLIQIYTREIKYYIISTVIICGVLYLSIYSLYKNKAKSSGSSKKSRLTLKERELVVNKLEQIFYEEKVYRESNLTLTKLSQKTKIPTYKISIVINKEFHKTFPEFVNYFRVREVVEKLHDNSKNNLTIEGLAYEVGFNTPSAFYHSFKKEMGQTPKQYKEST